MHPLAVCLYCEDIQKPHTFLLLFTCNNLCQTVVDLVVCWNIWDWSDLSEIRISFKVQKITKASLNDLFLMLSMHRWKSDCHSGCYSCLGGYWYEHAQNSGKISSKLINFYIALIWWMCTCMAATSRSYRWVMCFFIYGFIVYIHYTWKYVKQLGKNVFRSKKQNI